MKRVKYLMLFAIYVLALVNLAVVLPKPEVKLDFDPNKVERIEQYFVENRRGIDPSPKTDRCWMYTDPAAIREFCEVLANLYIQEYPYEELSEKRQEYARDNTQYLLYRVVMKNGRVEEFYQSSQFLRVGDHWCYMICGEEDGYQPFAYRIDKIEFERITNDARPE